MVIKWLRLKSHYSHFCTHQAQKYTENGAHRNTLLSYSTWKTLVRKCNLLKFMWYIQCERAYVCVCALLWKIVQAKQIYFMWICAILAKEWCVMLRHLFTRFAILFVAEQMCLCVWVGVLFSFSLLNGYFHEMHL